MDNFIFSVLWCVPGIVINGLILTNQIQAYPKPLAVVLLSMCMLPIIVPIVRAIIKLVKKGNK